MNSLVKLGAASVFLASSLHAATIVTPVNVTSVGGTIHQSALSQVYDNSGLSADLDNGANVPSVLPTHENDYGNVSVRWIGLPSSVTFDLGSVMTIEDIIFYNYSETGENDRGISSVMVEVSSNGSTYTSAGSLSFAIADTGATFAGEIVSFEQTNVSHVRFTNFVNHSSGSDNIVGFSEIRFTSVPEPSSAALLGLGGLALILRRRK